MLRIELDNLSRPRVLALLEEHLRNMSELSAPDKCFVFDASNLKSPGVTFWTAWNDDLLLGCAALRELSATEGEIKSMRTPSALRSCPPKTLYHSAGFALCGPFSSYRENGNSVFMSMAIT